MHNFFYTSNLYPTEEAAFDALNNDSVDAVVMGSLSNQKGYIHAIKHLIIIIVVIGI